MPAPAYNYANDPTAIAVKGVGEQLYTAYQFVQDAPTHRKQLMERHGLKKNFYTMLKELGLGSPISGPMIGHYEKDWARTNFAVGSVVTAPTGAGQPGVYAIAAGSMYTTNIQGIGAVSFSYPAKWDIIHLPNGNAGQIIAKDTSVTPHQITVKPYGTTETLVGAIAANGRYFIGDNALPEGSGSVDVKQARYVKYSNRVQIIKSRFAITGTAMTNALPFRNIEGKEGSFLIEGTTDTERLQMDRISKALFFGKQNNNLTGYSDALGHDVPVLTTQGLDDYIEQNGNILTITPGSLAIGDFDNIGEILNRERVNSNTVLMPMGFGLKAELDNLLKDFMDNTCFTYAAGNFPKNAFFSETDAKDHFLWLDFAGVRKNGRNFLFKYQSELDEQMGAGTEGYNWRNTGYAIPVDSFKNGDGTNALVPTIGYQYKALGGYNREWEMYKHGGAGPIQKTSEIDAMNLEFRSELGGHFGLGNQMVKLKPNS